MDSVKKIHRVLIGLPALIGLLAMSYLTYIHFSGTTSFCDVSAGLSCDAVTSSIYSEIFGLPVSILGILYFTYALSVSLSPALPHQYRFLFFLSVFVIVPSLYLTLMEAFVIHSFCILCETSKVMMLIILATSFFVIRKDERPVLSLAAPIAAAAIVISGIIYLIQTSYFQ